MIEPGDALDYIAHVHTALAEPLLVPTRVARQVQSLAAENSFPESCFCKALVLPVVDACTTDWLAARYGADPSAVRAALCCEGFGTPMYAMGSLHSGFSRQTHTKTEFPGSKDGHRTSSRRSPDFCVRFDTRLRVVGETKYVPLISPSTLGKLADELRDYLSIPSDPLSDWGHDFGYGIAYGYARTVGHWRLDLRAWDSDRIAISWFGD